MKSINKNDIGLNTNQHSNLFTTTPMFNMFPGNNTVKQIKRVRKIKKTRPVVSLGSEEKHKDPLPTSLYQQQTSDEDLIADLVAFLEDITEDNGSLHKQDVIKQYCSGEEEAKKDFRQLIILLHDPLITFGVTRRALEKFMKKPIPVKIEQPDNFIALLQKLSARELSGHAALTACRTFLLAHKDEQDAILKALDRDLKARINISTINKAVPRLITEYKVALANSLNDKTDKHLNNGDWFISRKLDGVRVQMIRSHDGNVKTYSRAGKEFTTLEPVKEAILKHSLLGKQTGWVLDGEMCALDSKGNEDFKKAVSAIKSSTEEKVAKRLGADNHFHFKIFDFLSIEEFKMAEGKRSLGERLESLSHLMPKSLEGRCWYSIVEQTPYTTEDFERLSAAAANRGWEGLMLRKNCGYKGKRSNDILKVKKFHTEEFVVKGITASTKKILDATSGQMVEKPILKAVQIKYKGNTVHVGSGFSDEERIEFLAHSDRIVGKTIAVQYFEETQEKNGLFSLRFPTFKALYGDKRTI
jgi:DNA ligase-1